MTCYGVPYEIRRNEALERDDERMETIKPLAEITEPDPRNLLWIIIDQETGADRRNTLKDMYAAVADFELGPNVPEKIRSQFAVAQNLAVYAWFCYHFHMNAELQAFACIEFALRLRLKPATRSQEHFKTMLLQAVKSGLMKDNGFRYFPVRQVQGPRTVPTPSGPKVVYSHVELLVETLPQMRNDLAHGATTLFDGGPGMIRLAADIINQLFATAPAP